MDRITRKEIESYVATFPRFREPELQGYLRTAIDRFHRTLNLIPRLPNPENVRLLEIGGVPYLMTSLIKHFFGYDVHVANEPTYKREGTNNIDILTRDGGETVEIPYQAFNIEYDTWPFEDAFFDIVLYCEVIEHLVYDPTQTLVECHRVLKKDTGHILISTPNALNYTFMVDMLRGRNFFPPFVGYSYYARHHRLFSCQELAYLTEKIGFEVADCYSVYDESYAHPPRLERIVRWLAKRGKLRGRLDVIYLLGTPHGEPRFVYPDGPPFAIYTDTHAYPKRAFRSSVVMADGESTQLNGGFHGLEPWGGGVRWTGTRARFTLRRADQGKLSLTFFTGPPERGALRGWIAFEDAGATNHRQEFEADAGEWTTKTFELPEKAQEETVVVLGIDTPWVPSTTDRSSADGRELGVAVREISLH